MRVPHDITRTLTEIWMMPTPNNFSEGFIFEMLITLLTSKGDSREKTLQEEAVSWRMNS